MKEDETQTRKEGEKCNEERQRKLTGKVE
jgi:hypothetical protein